MTTSTFDPSRYKATQRQEWDSAAHAWERWGDLIEEGTQDVTRTLIELGQVQPGHRVLDIAGGTGEPALTIARHVGPSGRVIITDQSPRMLDVARSRAATRRLENLEFAVTDAEALDYPGSSLDAATCRFGLMFLPDLAGTLQRIHRSLRPGGWFAAAVWDVPPRVPMISVAMSMSSQMFEVPAPPPGAPGIFSLSQPGMLEQAFTAAGFTNTRTQAATVDLELSSGEQYMDMILDLTVPLTVIVERQSQERKQEFMAALSEAAQQYAVDDGKIRMVNSALCVAGQRSI